MNKGWIRLYRILLDKTIWKNSTPEQKSIFIALLLMVNHTSAQWEWQGKKYDIQPGQTITSLEEIANLAGKGISIQNVRTALKRFEKLGFLTNESTKTGRLITILNWDTYQTSKNYSNKDQHIKPTKNQQSNNNEPTTNNNTNNIYNKGEANKSCAAPSDNLSLKLIKLFCDLHRNFFHQEYIITNETKEIAAAQKLIELLTSNHNYTTEIELIASLEIFLTECFNTDNKWIRENISLNTILNKINFLNKTQW
jgi:hypothetical protein